MPRDEILYDIHEHIATITLNRPEKLNAWTLKMEQEVRAAMQEARYDESVRVIVLTGAGRGFCAGADISVLDAITKNGSSVWHSGKASSSAAAHSKDAVRQDFLGRYSYLLAIPKPIIAAINGPAVGLGLVISLYCDLRFASSSARFGTVFSRRGLIAEYGLAWLLEHLVGHANALDLLFSGRMIDADEAMRMGLVNKVFPGETFEEGINEYARDLVANVSPRSLRVLKRQVYEAMFQTLAQATDLSEQEMLRSFQSNDFKEGVAHFIERRPPSFTGK